MLAKLGRQPAWKCLLALAAMSPLASCRDSRECRRTEQSPVQSPTLAVNSPAATRTRASVRKTFVAVVDGIIHVASDRSALARSDNAVDSADLVDRLRASVGRGAKHDRRGEGPLWTRVHDGNDHYEPWHFKREAAAQRADAEERRQGPLLLLDRDSPGRDLVWLARALDGYESGIATRDGEHVVAVRAASSTQWTGPTIVLHDGAITFVGPEGLTASIPSADRTPDEAALRELLAIPGFSPRLPRELQEDDPALAGGVHAVLVDRDTVGDAMPVFDVLADAGANLVEVAYDPPAITLDKFPSIAALRAEVTRRQSWPLEVAARIQRVGGPLDDAQIGRVVKPVLARTRNEQRDRPLRLRSRWQGRLTVTVRPDGRPQVRKSDPDADVDLHWTRQQLEELRFPRATSQTLFYVFVSGNGCWVGSTQQHVDEQPRCVPSEP
jgi:hypothetical protein